MRVLYKYEIPFVGKRLLVERLLRDLMKRKKVWDRAFKAQSKRGKLGSVVEASAYTALAELIVWAEEVVREVQERVRLYALSPDEQLFELYGVWPRVLTPEEAEKIRVAVADYDRRHVLIQHTAEADAEGRQN